MTIQNLPRQFGKYVLMRKIAMGGMAEIFKAKAAGAEGFEKEIVIKRILPHFTEDEAFVKMFIDEASITSKLQHANIVQIFDFDLLEGTYYIAMEYVEGVDLKKVIDEGIKRGTPLSVAQCVFLIMELSKGLHYAHVKEHKGKPLNIVHRDISPHNAMVSYNAEVKLMDFGIAKAAQRSTKTMAGTVKGKVAYMSPEQARGKPLDGRSDLFALGIMLWEMLTHKRLFLGDSDFETLTAVLKTEAPPPSSIDPKVPPELDALVLKALEKDRDRRFPSVEAFNRELTRWYYSSVGDLEAEALKPFMQSLFADEIAQLQVYAAEERGLPAPARGAAAATRTATPAPATFEPPADSDRTVALPASDYDPQQAQTLLDDGTISQAQIRQALQAQQAQQAKQRPGAAPVSTQTQPRAEGTYSNQLLAEKKGKGWLAWVAALLFLGGGGFAAWYFMTQDKAASPAPIIDGQGASTVAPADAELVLMVTPREALVKVNGTPVEGRASGLEIGKRARVEAVAPGYRPYDEAVMIEERSQPLEITLEKAPVEVTLLIEAVGDDKAIIRVNGKPGPNPQSVRGFKGDTLEVEIVPSGGGDSIKRAVVLDGSSPIHKIELGPAPGTDVRLLLSVTPADAVVKANKGTVSASAESNQAIISGLQIDDAVTVEVSRAGYETQEKTFRIAGDNQVVSIALDKRRATPTPTPTPTPTTGNGTVRITATPFAQIEVGGKPMGSTPRELTLPAGKHRVVLTRNTDRQERWITVRPNQTVSVTHDFTK